MIQISDIKEICRNKRDVEVPALLSFVESVISSNPLGVHSMIDVSAHYSYATYANGLRSVLGSRAYHACDILDDENTRKIVDKYFISNVTDIGLEKYDIVSCVSVIEHCGITTYKAENIENEQMGVFNKLVDITNKALFLSFTYGRPGLYPEQYSNIHEEMLVKMEKYWKDKMGANATINFNFFYNENSVLSQPWISVSRLEASQVEMNMNVGQCFCILEAYSNEIGENI